MSNVLDDHKQQQILALGRLGWTLRRIERTVEVRRETISRIRRECLDHTLFWTAADLETKLLDFQRYYNGHRTHAGLDGRPPEPRTDSGCGRANVRSYRWQSHCRGLYQTPIAA